MNNSPKKISIPVPRGMLFLYDRSAGGVEIPTYRQGEVVSSSKTAISIATISDFDGETSIEIAKSKSFIPKQLVELFSGELYLENRVLNLCLMADEPISSITTEYETVDIKIYGNKVRFPTSIFILIE